MAAEFREDHLLPRAAAIWSCTIHEIRDYPAASFIAFCDSHGLMNFLDKPIWRTVVGGSRALCSKDRPPTSPGKSAWGPARRR